MKRTKKFLSIFAMGLVFSTQANAALQDRGTDTFGRHLIYDNDINITWYDYSKSSDEWQNQMDWASGLTVNFGGTIFDDWRLPTTADGPFVYGNDGTTTAGYNITNSEMGHLYYTELGNKGYSDISGNYPQPGWGLINKGDFQDLQRYYWSGTEYAGNKSLAWAFITNTGIQYNDFKDTRYDAIAVRSGDVAPPVAPEPVSMVLFGAGGVVMAARRKLIKRR